MRGHFQILHWNDIRYLISSILKLQIKLTDFAVSPATAGTQYIAKYDSFRVGSESTNYKLSLSGYDSDSSTLGDAFSDDSGMPFSTRDKNNGGTTCGSKLSAGKNPGAYILLVRGHKTTIL